MFRSEVDFFLKRRLSEGKLDALKSDKFYPPRFEGYFASYKANATLDDGKIMFKGATSDIVFDLHLDCPTVIQGTLFCCSCIHFCSSRFITAGVERSTQTETHLLLGA